jgi:hypothetical protein
MAQIMDLDLRKESEREQAEKAFKQNKDECYFGGGAEMLDDQAQQDTQGARQEIDHFYAWLDEGTADYHNAQVEVILESGAKSGGGVDAQTSSAIVSGSNGGASTTAKSVDTEKGLKVGEKRKRTTFSAVQQVYLQNALDKGELNTKEGRQLAADVLSKEAGKSFDIASIDNWWRNHKKKGKTAS